MSEGLSAWVCGHVHYLLVLLCIVGCSNPLHRAPSTGDGGDLGAVADSASLGGGTDGPDAAGASAVPETQADGPPNDLPCALMCIASNSDVGLSGYVDLASADSSAVDVDDLEITVCHDSTCAVLPRESQYDSQSTAWNCADAGVYCVARVFGSAATSAGTLYAYVTLTSTRGSLYAVGGSVMFRLSVSGADAASTTRITIRSGDVTYLDASSSDCRLNLGCCGNLYYETCNLSWN